METLTELPKAINPISKEALARCVEIQTRDKILADRVRADTSFDGVVVSSAIIDEMKVTLVKFNGNIPMFNIYCGNAVQKAMTLLPYNNPYHFYNGTIRLIQ